MAIVITVAEINELCPSTLPDAFIQNLIDTVSDSMGDCVESSYPLSQATTILKNTICHLVVSNDAGEIKTEKAANGASTTYENHGGGDGLRSTYFGRLVITLDTEICYNALFAETFLFLSGGNPATPQ